MVVVGQIPSGLRPLSVSAIRLFQDRAAWLHREILSDPGMRLAVLAQPAFGGQAPLMVVAGTAQLAPSSSGRRLPPSIHIDTMPLMPF
jgi:hypothetical protein